MTQTLDALRQQETKQPPYAFLIKACSLIAGSMGVIVLEGWIFDEPKLRSVLEGAVQMKVNTALGLILAATALFHVVDAISGRASKWVNYSGILLILLGTATLSEYLFGWNLGIDEALFRDTAKAFNVAPGRMAPMSAIVFTALGTSFLLLQSMQWRRWAVFLADLMTGIGILGMLGYLLDAPELVTDQILPPVAIHTAFAFTLLGVGIALVGRTAINQAGGYDPSKESIQGKVAVGWSAALLIILAGGGVTYRAYTDFANASRMVVHTLEVRNQLESHISSITRAESALRAYLLTGQERYKSDFATATLDARSHLDALGTLTRHNRAQMQQIDPLRLLSAARLKQLGERFAQYDKIGLKPMQEILRSGTGSSVMTELRRQTVIMDQIETELLKKREAQALANRSKALIYLIATLLGTTAVFIFQIRGIGREMFARSLAEQRLSEMNLELGRAMLAAQAANEEKSAFLTSMSKELRAPLYAISDTARLIRREPLSPTQTAQLDKLEAAEEQLLGIINNTIDISKGKTGNA